MASALAASNSSQPLLEARHSLRRRHEQSELTETKVPVDGRGAFRLEEGSVATSAVLLCSAALGTGVLALPYGMMLVGILPALVLLCLAAMSAGLSNILIFRCAHVTGKGDYGELMKDVLGVNGAAILDGFIFLEGLAAVATYLVFIGDYVPQVCALLRRQDSDSQLWCEHRSSVIYTVSLFIWPLCCLKNLSALRDVSTWSLAAILFTSVAVIVRTPSLFESHGQRLIETVLVSREAQPSHGVGDMFQVFSLLCFAFMTHTNTPEIAQGLKSPSQYKFRQVVWAHVAILVVVYGAIAVAGYLSFLGATNQDFLTNYSVADPLIALCRCALSVTLIFACPINMLPAMKSLFNILEHCSRQQASGSRLSENRGFRLSVTTLCFAVAFLVALRTPHIADLIGAIGAFGSSPLMFAFPAMMYRKILHGRNAFITGFLLMLTVALWAAECLRLLS